MAVTETSVLAPGRRVRIRRGRFPADPELVGRTGMVVENSQYSPHKVEVTLDGEPGIRAFSPAEVEVLEGAAALASPDREDAKKRLARP